MSPDGKDINSFEQQQLDRLMDEGGPDPEMMKNQRRAAHRLLEDNRQDDAKESLKTADAQVGSEEI